MNTPNRNSEQRLREHAERNLSALVIAIEFTLISVMVGVILFPLMDYATPLLRDLRFEFWLYILGGLMFILLLWTQVISHSLAFIGWPIDIGHNLLYIVFALFLAIQMHFLADPRGWFAISCASTIVAWLLVYYDARVIEQRMQGASGSALALFNVALARQRRLSRGMVIAFADALFNIVLIVLLPAVFIEQPGHLALIALQTAFVFLLTGSTIQVFKSWTEPIVRKAMDELKSEGEK
jgi:hypothetical protein